jgi:uncharacterized membrane protein
MNLFEYVGKFHPLVIHLPIGILMVFLVVGFIIPRKQLQESYKIIWLILLVSALSATFSCISGIVLADSGSYDARLTNNHKIFGITLALLNWLIFFSLKKLLQSPLWIYYSSLFLILITTTLTGHLGGSLTHGSDFLTPPKPSEWFGSSSDLPDQSTLNSTAFESASLIFEQKCNMCHGENKQKGDLRLDTKEGFLAGGEGGSMLPNDKSKSILLERIMLPLDDDDHMPPMEKKQLTEMEISYLNWWIKNGADMNKTLGELDFPDSLRSFLIQDESNAFNNLIPQQEVNQPDKITLDKLNSLNVMLSPIALNSNYLSVSFMNVLPENGTAAMEECAKLKQQIVWLNIDYQNIDTLAWQQISLLTNLRKLSVKNSNLDDDKMNYFETLDSLVSLNLVGTKVSLPGLLKIKTLQNLESIYIYQTNVDEAGFSQLKMLFPLATIDFGYYEVPILQSDTTIFKL